MVRAAAAAAAVAAAAAGAPAGAPAAALPPTTAGTPAAAAALLLPGSMVLQIVWTVAPQVVCTTTPDAPVLLLPLLPLNPCWRWC
jgi:hypothetical protein